jgi:hypothetical protein
MLSYTSLLRKTLSLFYAFPTILTFSKFEKLFMKRQNNNQCSRRVSVKVNTLSIGLVRKLSSHLNIKRFSLRNKTSHLHKLIVLSRDSLRGRNGEEGDVTVIACLVLSSVCTIPSPQPKVSRHCNIFQLIKPCILLHLLVFPHWPVHIRLFCCCTFKDMFAAEIKF